MNKLEANISLFAITLFSVVQYVFLAGLPDGLSHFAFLSVTNLIGFFITLTFFFGELFRLDTRQIVQSIVLSGELMGFNVFMLMGVRGIDPAVSSAVLSSYFVFILIFESFLHKKIPDKHNIASVVLVLIGLFLMINADVKSLFNINIFYFLIADIFFAIYVMTVGSYASSSNPSILAMGQMLFCFIFSLVLWILEILTTDIPFALPMNKEFWVGVIYTSFFIRGLYGVIQIYAQRYVSPLNTSLIFSSEIVMTMLISPLLAHFFNIASEVITPLKIIGSVFIVSGLVIMEPAFIQTIKKLLSIKIKLPEKQVASNIKASQKIFVVILTAFVYILVDIPVMMTGFLPDYAGIKNAMPFITGLFFGIYGIIGSCIGCIFSSFMLDETAISISWECWCIFITGICMYYGWHLSSKSHRIHFKTIQHYMRYVFLAILASILCFNFDFMASYFITGILIGLPVNILFGSLLYVEPFVPSFAVVSYDAEFELENVSGSLDKANDILESSAEQRRMNMKRIFEIQSCLEELSIRIFNAIPDAKIKVSVIYYDAISMRIDYPGKKYNPFKINNGEDILDIMSLKIIKHRALRASFAYYNNKNNIHVVL